MGKISFEIKQHHLDLLKKGYWKSNDFCEFGTVGLDTKRPFGNGDVYNDMSRIIYKRTKEEYSEEKIEEFNKIYFDELPTVLEIIFNTNEIKTGKYEKEEFSNKKWRMIK